MEKEQINRVLTIMDIQSESRVLLEKAINDLNILKHQTVCKNLKDDINTSIDLLNRHKETFKFNSVRDSIMEILK